MAPTNSKLIAAKQMRDSAQALLDEAAKLEKQAKQEELPPVPTGNFWRVDVKFSPGGSTYTYLLLRHGQKWYTTGVDERTAVFKSWNALWEWLEGPDVYSHSELQRLIHSGSTTNGKIEHGLKPKLGIAQVNFW